MKKLLIHNNNTSFNNTELFTLAEQFVFDVDFDKDVDFYINENLINGALNQKLENCDIVFIKLALSNNYLEFLGLRLAYHIRLTKYLGNNAIIPIVFIGEEELQFIGLTYSEPSILLTRGIYLIKESYESYTDIMNYRSMGIIKPLDNLATFINSISIKPPSNYLSHHSIANEWSILRWAKVLGMSTTNGILNELNTNVESLLYYKYLHAKYPIDKEPNLEPLRIEGKGRILYIDDEWNKGWSVFLENILLSSPSIDFETFKYEFIDKTQNEILTQTKKKIENYEPDVVLLDLRLSELDFSEGLISKELTGYKILKSIKLINPGIQVIIFTASNKVWNLLELQAIGADGFLLKESPELSVDASFSFDSLSSLNNQFIICLNKSYLKSIWTLFHEIQLIFSKNPLSKKYFQKDINEQINAVKYQNLLLQELDSIFEILNTNNENRFNMAMIMLYKILEYLNEIFYKKVALDKPPLFFDNTTVDYFDKNTKTWKKPNDLLEFYNKDTRKNELKKIKAEWLKSTSNKVLNLAVRKLNIKDKNVMIDLISITDYRNDYIHSDTSKRNKLKVLTSDDILKWTISIAITIKNI